jgi:putative peptide zinc metalloprotease protein
MKKLTTFLLAALLSIGLTAAPAVAQEERQGDDNHAIAINTEDGATIFRLAFSVRMVTNGVVDQTNAAVALASCTDCQTIALAFQVVLVSGDVDVVVPENLALAVNDECIECVTYASATQIVLGFDGHVRLTGEGRRRLAALHQALRDLEDRAADLSLVELNAEVQAAKQELISILNTELVEIVTPSGPATTTSTSTSTPSSTTITTEDGDVEDDSDTTTTTDADADTTTTSAPEDATTTTSTATTEAPTTTTAAAP